MTRAHKIIGFLLVTLFGAYGCSQGPPGASDRSTAPTSKLQRLEDDLRAAAAARDQYRQKYLAAEEREARLQRELETIRAELTARTAERDKLATQYDGFRKSLKDLLAQAESNLASPGGSLSAPTTIGVEIAPMPSAVGGGTGN